MDTQIEELKALVRRNIELSTETNKVVHAMRRSERRSKILRIAWFLFIALVVGGAYYYYASPYIEKIQRLYETAQGFLPK